MPAWLAPSLFVSGLGLVGWLGARVIAALDRATSSVEGLVTRVAEHEVRIGHLEREMER